MFSYLHGIRPNNRRSATPQIAAPPQSTTSRYYHESPPSFQAPSTFNLDPPLSRTSQTISLNESPVSSNPPVLPPIPRVASQRESERVEDKDARLQKDDPAPSKFEEPPQRQIPPVPQPPVIRDSFSTLLPPKDRPNRITGGFPIGIAPTQPDQIQSQAPVRRARRPIDAAYEAMRSYNEPFDRQSLGTRSENQLYIPEPSRRPPPPPANTSNTEPEHQRQAPPPLGKPSPQAQPTPIQNRHGKTRLNLLNPMSLLARRRPTQAVEADYSQSQTVSGMPLPDDYDPRIRGKVVHDFSAPRPGRNDSIGESTTPAVQMKEKRGSSDISQKRVSPHLGHSFLEDESPSSTEKEHTPVFKENFDDNVESWHDGLDSPAKRRTSAFMYKMSLQEAQPEPNPSSLPAFARALPPKATPKAVQTIPSSIDDIRIKSPPPPNPPLEKVLEMPLPNQESAQPSPPISPPKTRSRSTSLSDPNLDAPGPPRRYKSNASRFSFDLAGVGSAAQEQLLEERHRQQKAKRKEREGIVSACSDTYDDDDEYADYDDMEDDDGLEEKIPGVNADDSDFELPLLQPATEMSFTSPNKSSFDSVLSPVSTGLTSPGTPRDSQGQQKGFVISKSSPKVAQLQLKVSQSPSKQNSSRSKSVPGVASDPSPNVQTLPREIASESNLAGLPNRYDYEEDDMYFDDGMIEDIGDEDNQEFDESVFDDDTSRVYGLPLRDLKPLTLPQNLDDPMISQVKGPESDVALHPSSNLDSTTLAIPESPEDDATAAELMDSVTDLKQPTRGSFSQAAGLTQDNLGLHDQLAMAANQAELAGRFQRSYSLASTHESNNNYDTSAQIHPYDNLMTLPVNSFSDRIGEDAEGFDLDDAHIGFDDEEADDTIIAAANAEALENDDDGFYGQEFGFFARASGSSEAEYVHGGYFGPRALEGIQRMNSGRRNKDPSLTPITERSEWSNRNSAISLALHGYPLSAQFTPNPQRVSLTNVLEDEMSLESLRKLRRGAWGSSDVSLQSSSNSPNSGSPITYLPPGMIVPSLLQPTNSNGQLVNTSNQNLAGSFHSFSSSTGHPSSAGSSPSPLLESPTITLSTSQPSLYIQQPIGPPPPPPAENTSPVRRNAVNGKGSWAPGHSRNSSGAESVSYREEGGKWVCEKRRVDATGEIEVLGRSVVEGGRI